MKKKNIGFIGLGKLGQPCAEVIAEAGHNVYGFDLAKRSPNGIEMCDTTLDFFKKATDIVFIALPTPHDPLYGGSLPIAQLEPKDFDYQMVKTILDVTNVYANSKTLIVLISTVLPGTVRREFIPLIKDKRFIYNPYLIAMGTVKEDMVNPEMVIIGTKDGNETTDAKELIDFYKTVIKKRKTRYVVGTWDEAESIKIFYNTFISAKLSLVNMIQDVAEKNGNIDVDIVTKALQDSTQRIMGPAYMTAGMGDGGPCHPRDNIALRYMAENLELGYDLFSEIMISREIQAKNLASTCLKHGKNITILGKAYKPGVPYTDGSYSLLVGHFIEELGGTVSYYDPNTGDTELNDTDVYLIGYWEDWVENFTFSTGTVIIDPWRRMKYNKDLNIIHYGNTRA